MNKEYTLGYFLEIRHIEGAYQILKKQIEQESPVYNTLDFKIFRDSSTLLNFNSADFYKRLVENDVYYYFKDEGFIIDYLGIQAAYKIRNYHFLSFQSLIVYNAIGLYIHEVLNQYQTDFDVILKKAKGKVFYGGRLNHKTPSYSNIFYHEDYQEFLSKKEAISEPKTGKTKYVITVDIKSFFYSVNHKVLLNIIKKNATEVSKKKLRFDEKTIASIEFFLKYLMSGNTGLPVSSQNLVSSYLSSVYFAPFDQYLANSYLTTPTTCYIRYVDDFYIVFENDVEVLPSESRNLIYQMENDISDFLNNQLCLNTNSQKGKRTQINDLTSYHEFLAITNETSQGGIEYAPIQIVSIAQERSIKGKSIQSIFTKSIEIIKDIKDQLNGFNKLIIKKEDNDFLNNIFSKNVLNYSRSKKALEEIERNMLFLNYDSLDFVLAKIKVFLLLISSQRSSREHLHNLIISDETDLNNVNQRLVLIERYVLQLEFLSSKDKKEKIITKKEIQKYKMDYKKLVHSFVKFKPQNFYAKLVLKMLDKETQLTEFKPIYNSDFLNLEENTSLMQQIKQRHLKEGLNSFNVAFNHLLNEFQNLIEATFFEGKKKDALEIRAKLNEKNFSVEEILLVSDFFKRRNQNSISHTNDLELGFWAVTEKEYNSYKQKIKPIVEKLFETLKENSM